MVSRYARLFGRGALQASLVAANTYQISHSHGVGTAVVGFLISAVWWHNSRSTNRNDDLPMAGAVYAAGAAAGTMVGAGFMSCWYG